MGGGRSGLAAEGLRGLSCAIAAPNFEVGEERAWGGEAVLCLRAPGSCCVRTDRERNPSVGFQDLPWDRGVPAVGAHLVLAEKESIRIQEY